jgi:hypothetical protein
MIVRPRTPDELNALHCSMTMEFPLRIARPVFTDAWLLRNAAAIRAADERAREAHHKTRA